MGKWLGADAMLLAYAAGVVLAPGALLGLWLALRRRDQEELAFGALTTPFVAALLIEAAAYGLGGDRIQERFAFYAVPLVGILFALYASRGWPHRLAHGVLAAGLVLLAARVPLSGFAAADSKTNSPTLFAAARLEQALGDVATASLLALGITLLAGVLVLEAGDPGQPRLSCWALRSPSPRQRMRARSPTTWRTPSGRGPSSGRSRPSSTPPGSTKPQCSSPARRGRLRVPVLEPLPGRRVPASGRRAARLLPSRASRSLRMAPSSQPARP